MNKAQQHSGIVMPRIQKSLVWLTMLLICAIVRGGLCAG
jgi:hypothetical protein